MEQPERYEERWNWGLEGAERCEWPALPPEAMVSSGSVTTQWQRLASILPLENMAMSLVGQLLETMWMSRGYAELSLPLPLPCYHTLESWPHLSPATALWRVG